MIIIALASLHYFLSHFPMMEVPATAAAAVSSEDIVDTNPPTPLFDEARVFAWLEDPSVKLLMKESVDNLKYGLRISYAGTDITLSRNFDLPPSDDLLRNFNRDFISAAEDSGKSPKGWFRHKTYDPNYYVLNNLKVKFSSGTPVTPTVVVQFGTSHSVVFRRRPTEAERLAASTPKYHVA